LTGENGHRNETINGQRVSRDSLPTLLYFLFFPQHIFFNSILLPPANGTLAFALPIAIGTQANPSAKAKEPFFSQRTKTTIKTLNKVIFFNLTD